MTRFGTNGPMNEGPVGAQSVGNPLNQLNCDVTYLHPSLEHLGTLTTQKNASLWSDAFF